jgi:hypothetical protein
MDPEIIDYPPDGTLDDLRTTCTGDEKGFRGRLANLKRVQDAAGKKAIRATYNVEPLDKPFPKKKLFFFDITDASPSERHDITVEQLAQGHVLAFPTADRAEVYLGDEEAVVAVYREA